MKCDKCGNRLGFALGTCVQCGYNYHTHEYDVIKVYTKELQRKGMDILDIYDLIDEHDKSTTKFNV